MTVNLLKYPELAAQLAAQYKPIIEALLERIADRARQQGLYASGVVDLSCDDFRWSLAIKQDEGDPEESLTDITIEIAEERGYESEGFGVNFMLSIVRYGGLIVGNFAPYNYSEACWVDMRVPYEVSTRWEYMASVDADDVIETILADFDKQNTAAA